MVVNITANLSAHTCKQKNQVTSRTPLKSTYPPLKHMQATISNFQHIQNALLSLA